MAKKNEQATQRLNEVFLRGRISHVYGSERGGSLTIPYSVTSRKANRDEEGNVTFTEVAETFFRRRCITSIPRPRKSFRISAKMTMSL